MKGQIMKRLLIVALFAVATIAVSGCKEKTTEEKLQDAAEQAEKDVNAGAKDLNKQLDGALGK
jgi:outer membrane lipoprotein-sorting protein